MATQVQRRRGTNAEVEAFTGALGEFILDTTNNRISSHNGATAGGFPIANYLDLQKAAFTYALATGTANALVGSPAKNPDALQAGMSVFVKAASTNTGAATLNWGGLGVKNIKKYDATSKVDVEADDIIATKIARYDYDGTDWVIDIGGAGGIKPKSSLVASTSSSLDFNSVFELGNNYDIEFANLRGSVDTDFWARFTDDNGSTYESSAYVHHGRSYANATGSDYTGSTVHVFDTNDAGGGQDQFTEVPAFSGRLTLYNPALADRTQYEYRLIWNGPSSAIQRQLIGGGYLDLTTALTGFRVDTDSGTIDAGTVSVFERPIDA